jgi:serine/threonine protein kinase
MSQLQSNAHFPWNCRIKMAHDIISGLRYLHDCHLIHRDIKSANVLINSNWVCKISDFGMTKNFNGVSDAAKKKMTYCGTDSYMAPELLFEEEYGVESDIYSYGMVLLEIMKRAKVGENDFAMRPASQAFRLDEELTRSQLPADAPESLVILAFQCLDYESINRPTGEGISGIMNESYSNFVNVSPQSGYKIYWSCMLLHFLIFLNSHLFQNMLTKLLLQKWCLRNEERY